MQQDKKNNIIIKQNISFPLIIFIMGPTASGKTSLVIALKKRKLKIKIISVDSALVYKGMNIGTSKPSVSELEIAPHKLIDIRDPSDCYSVSDFYCDVIVEIKKIIKSGYVPVLVGGSMLYFKVLLQGLLILPKSDEVIRNNLKCIAQKIGWMNVYRKLQYIDPDVSRAIHYNDHKRIIRALEIFLISGKTLTELKSKYRSATCFTSQNRILQFAIMPSSREILHNRIERRFYKMLEIGFENEVRVLFSRSDLHNDKSKAAISCVGYRQMWEYLLGKIEYNDMIYQSISATKRVAKQQLTWLRSWSDLYWVNSDCISCAVDEVLLILSQQIY
ncbi:tRNA dimethylallyltransferase [Candidatus Blochmanniella vafra str. BVAF]|uniref:tRNA dimethylallyltransferase n=1 Tax=Blochmanniella vafra (strain BVAF) TaxID=859654 RepID=E8Q6P7_BLOVB|nr:tRNA (adenosine(37)-N6)-dimethylallyltransferase MiaA [Candidatus Blochmannia vafer]ADV33488.1 tRNA dimethylallyltransferase [Candidatus Blochmannia vafer str. BVAF]